MIDQDVDEFLEHFGVQGMKWGSRRAANKSNVANLQRKGLSSRQAKKHESISESCRCSGRMTSTGKKWKS